MRRGRGPLTNLVNHPADLEHDFGIGIQGFDDVPETLPEPLAGALAGVSRTPLAGTDVLVVRGPVGEASGVRAENSDRRVFAVVRSRKARACPGNADRINGICPGDYLLLTVGIQSTGAPHSGPYFLLRHPHQGRGALDPSQPG